MQFSEIEPGTHFSLPSTPTIQWIKTTICNLEECLCCTRNAVCLNDGTYVNFAPHTQIQMNCHWE